VEVGAETMVEVPVRASAGRKSTPSSEENYTVQVCRRTERHVDIAGARENRNELNHRGFMLRFFSTKARMPYIVDSAARCRGVELIGQRSGLNFSLSSNALEYYSKRYQFIFFMISCRPMLVSFCFCESWLVSAIC
jgi:hypothetical protein